MKFWLTDKVISWCDMDGEGVLTDIFCFAEWEQKRTLFVTEFFILLHFCDLRWFPPMKFFWGEQIFIFKLSICALGGNKKTIYLFFSVAYPLMSILEVVLIKLNIGLDESNPHGHASDCG